jgi:hypothetical protein
MWAIGSAGTNYPRKWITDSFPDVTGKVMVPILAMSGYWEVTFGNQRMRLDTRAACDMKLRFQGVRAP